jgi:hypothetical protein
MKPGIFFLMLFTVFLARGQDDGDTNFFYVIHGPEKSYTNATIGSVTPATATIFWSGGGEEVMLADLPEPIQKKYHYDPLAAQAFLDARETKKRAAKRRNNDESAAVSAAFQSLDTPRLIQVIKVISFYEVEIMDRGVKTNAYVINLPMDVISFVNDYNETYDIVRLNIGYNTSETYRIGDGFHRAGELTDSAKIVLNARAHLAQLQTVALEKTTIVARPSVLIHDRFKVWKYEQGAEAIMSAQGGTGNSILALRLGVPLQVYDLIASRAAIDFPGDYDEQRYIVVKQLQAYRELHPN